MPTTAFLAWRTGQGRAKFPLFIVGFAAMAALGTFAPNARDLGTLLTLVHAAARPLLLASLMLVGAGISPRSLVRTGLRPLAHGATLWAAVSLLTLTAIRAGWIA